jgi:hypothetical protein
MNRVYRMSESQLEVVLKNQKIIKQGNEAHADRQGLDKNPYEKGTKEYSSWEEGWLDGETLNQMSHDDAQFRRERGFEEGVTEEAATTKDNIFKTEVSDVDFYIDQDALFREYAKPGVKNTIIVNNEEFDVYMNVSKAIANYELDIEYRSYGIKSIGLVPSSVYFIGSLELTGESNEFSKDFEIEVDNSGIKMNTLSGEFVMGDFAKINLGNLPNNISLDSKRTSEHDSFYVTSVEINQQGDNMIIQLQY